MTRFRENPDCQKANELLNKVLFVYGTHSQIDSINPLLPVLSRLPEISAAASVQWTGTGVQKDDLLSSAGTKGISLSSKRRKRGEFQTFIIKALPPQNNTSCKIIIANLGSQWGSALFCTALY